MAGVVAGSVSGVASFWSHHKTLCIWVWELQALLWGCFFVTCFNVARYQSSCALKESVLWSLSVSNERTAQDRHVCSDSVYTARGIWGTHAGQRKKLTPGLVSRFLLFSCSRRKKNGGGGETLQPLGLLPCFMIFVTPAQFVADFPRYSLLSCESILSHSESIHLNLSKSW